LSRTVLSSSLSIQIRLFSVARDLAGFDVGTLRLRTGACAGDVMTELGKIHPQLIKWTDSIRLAVNLEYVTNDYLLHDGDEVAVIPPVSGG